MRRNFSMGEKIVDTAEKIWYYIIEKNFFENLAFFVYILQFFTYIYVKA